MSKALHAPVNEQNRIGEIDIVRGFALFGVLLVNVAYFNSTFLRTMVGEVSLANPLQLTPGLERTTALLIKFLAEGKFYTIFSFLFGLGFYLFISRAEQKGLLSKPLFRRRMLALLVFGILNLVLVWWGDILHAYALGGFVLLVFKDRAIKTLRVWILLLLVFSTVISLSFSSSPAMLQSQESSLLDSQELVTRELIDQSIEVFQRGSYSEVVRFRLANEVPFAVGNLLFVLPKTMAMFLMGIMAGRLGIFSNLTGNAGRIDRTWRITGILGLLSIIGAVITGYPVIGGVIENSKLYSLCYELGTVLLSLFYVTSLLKLLRNNTFAKLLQPLQAVGRMALTNYLVQCVICSLVFYGHGLGYAEQMPLFTGVIFTVIFFAAQVVFSNIYFRYYRFGPFERIWRNYTYGKANQQSRAGESDSNIAESRYKK